MSGSIRSALQYLLAALVPIMIGAVWPWTQTFYPFPASVFFLCIAVSARFFGFKPALLCTIVSAITFWSIAIEAGMAEYPMQLRIVRVLLFVVAALVVASLSRQRSKEVRE